MANQHAILLGDGIIKDTSAMARIHYEVEAAMR